MHIKFIKNSLLLACASASISNAHAMDFNEKFRQQQKRVAKKEWVIHEDMNVIPPISPIESPHDEIRRTSVLADSPDKNTYIQRFTLAKMKEQGKFVTILAVNPNLLSPNQDAIEQSLLDTGIVHYIKKDKDTCNIQINVTKEETGEFCALFYDRALLPYDLVETIASHIEYDFIKMDTDSVIARINRQMKDNPTHEDFKKTALTLLLDIKKPAERAKVTWDLIRDLRGDENGASGNFDRQLIIDLCTQITDRSLPFYTDVQILSAELSLTDNTSETSIHSRYKMPMITLGKATSIPYGQKLYENFAKQYVNNGSLSNAYNDELKGLTVSSESMFQLLDIIRRQNLELQGKK